MGLPAVKDHLPLTQGGKPVACDTPACCAAGESNCFWQCIGATMPSTLYADLPAVSSSATNGFSTGGGVFACTKFDFAFFGSQSLLTSFNLPGGDATTYPGGQVVRTTLGCFYISGVIGSDCGYPVRAIIDLNGYIGFIPGWIYAGYYRVEVINTEISPGVFEDRYHFSNVAAAFFTGSGGLGWFPHAPAPGATRPPYYDNEATSSPVTEIPEGSGAFYFADCFDWYYEWEWYGQTVIEDDTVYCAGGPTEDYTIAAPAHTCRISTS